MGATLLIFASKTSIVSISIVHAKVNSSNLSGLEHSLWLSAHEHHQEKERDSQERGKEPVFSFRVQMRACPHCTEKSGRQLDRFCSSGRGSVRAATAGTVAPSHLLLKFGKLTIEFETRFQFRKAESRRPSVAAYGKVVPSRFFHLRSAS